VENGKAPDQVIGRGTVEGAGKKASFTQPICAYPKAAEYKGAGSRKNASSYTCAAK
jgi:feruloyl esterase